MPIDLPPEAWAVALACALTPLFVLCHVLLSRRQDEDAPGQNALLLAGVLFAFGWLAASLGIWGVGLRFSQSIAGFSTLVFVVLAWMQVYSQIGRGFSLRVVVDIDRCGGLDIDGILREYSDGRGAQWLIDKRLSGLF